MNKKQLQLLSIMTIGKSKLSEQAKLQLIRFVKEANDFQLKSFLLDGEIVKLDSVSEQIVNDRFEIHPLNEFGDIAKGTLAGILITLLIPFPFGIIGGAATGALVGAAVQSWKEKNEKKIKTFCASKFKENTSQYNTCISTGNTVMRIKLDKAKKQIKAKKQQKKQIKK